MLFGSIILEILYKEHDNHPNDLTYNLLRSVLDAIQNKISAQAAHWYFIIKYLEIEGLSLNTQECYHCNEDLDHAYFFPRKGYNLCESCREDFALNWELNSKHLTILQGLSSNSADALPRTIDKEINKELINRILWNTLATRFDQCRILKSVEVLRKVL